MTEKSNSRIFRIFFINMSLQSIVFDKEEGKLSILNQLLLPDVSLYEEINTVQDAWDAIKNMKVSV